MDIIWVCQRCLGETAGFEVVTGGDIWLKQVDNPMVRFRRYCRLGYVSSGLSS